MAHLACSPALCLFLLEQLPTPMSAAIAGAIITAGIAIVVAVVKYGSGLQNTLTEIKGAMAVDRTKYDFLREKVDEHSEELKEHGDRLSDLEKLPQLAEFGQAIETIVRAAKDVTPRQRGAHGG